MASNIDDERDESRRNPHARGEEDVPSLSAADADAAPAALIACEFDSPPSMNDSDALPSTLDDGEPAPEDPIEGPPWPWDEFAPPAPDTPRAPTFSEPSPREDTREPWDEPEPEPHDPIELRHLLSVVMSKKWYGQLRPTELMSNVQRWIEEGPYTPADMLGFSERAPEEFRAAHLRPGENARWPGGMSPKRAGGLLRALMLRNRVELILERLSLTEDEKVLNYYSSEARKLWEAAIGGSWEKQALMSLIDIVAHASELLCANSAHTPHAVELALGAFKSTFPEAGARVSYADFENAIETWGASGRKHGKRPSKWKAIKELATKAGLGPPSAETIKREYRHQKADIPI